MSNKKLTLDKLEEIIVGNAAAFRRKVELQPIGGQGSKIFPPTYEGGKYATEKRRINGQTIDCVLLDSVQSQANRMEVALQDAYEVGSIQLPMIYVDFTQTKASWIGKISTLQAPHRIADAILRDSFYGEKLFRQSAIGVALNTASNQDATTLLKYCPTALIFGMWDSAWPRGGLGVKFPRTIVSEIIGINAIPGQRTSSRIDPLQIALRSGPIYKAELNDWTLHSANAIQKQDKKGNSQPQKVGKKGEGKPSEINHGNVTPSFVFQKEENRIIKDKDGNPIPIGGFTIDYAEHITTLSLPAIRRLKFARNGAADFSRSAHVFLAALGLCAATLSGASGYDLRSQCALYTDKPLLWEVIGTESQILELNVPDALELFDQARQKAIAAKMPLENNPIALTPRADLVDLVVKSVELSASDEDEGEDS